MIFRIFPTVSARFHGHAVRVEMDVDVVCEDRRVLDFDVLRGTVTSLAGTACRIDLPDPGELIADGEIYTQVHDYASAQMYEAEVVSGDDITDELRASDDRSRLLDSRQAMAETFRVIGGLS